MALPRNQLVGNGAQTIFNYTFRIFADSDIAVYVDGEQYELDADYSVSGMEDPSGGEVTFVTPPANLSEIVFNSNQDHSRVTDYAESGPFFADTVNKDFDRRVVSDLQLQENFSRSIRLAPGLKYQNESLEINESPEDRANKVIGFDGIGDLSVRDDLATQQYVLDTISVTGNGTVLDVNASGGTTGLTLTGGPITQSGTLTLGGTLAVANGGTGSTTATGTGSAVLSASPALTGTPTVPTASYGDSSTKAASTAFVQTAVASGGFSTGDGKLTWKTTADPGWVMHSDGTIGKAGSGATYANADAQALFTLIRNNFSNTLAPVSGGRGVDATADWSAGKTITMPKALGTAIGVAGAGSGLTSRTLGEKVGAETHNHTGTTDANSGAFTMAGGAQNVASHPHTHTFTTDAGSSMQPTSFWNVMIKL